MVQATTLRMTAQEPPKSRSKASLVSKPSDEFSCCSSTPARGWSVQPCPALALIILFKKNWRDTFCDSGSYERAPAWSTPAFELTLCGVLFAKCSGSGAGLVLAAWSALGMRSSEL